MCIDTNTYIFQVQVSIVQTNSCEHSEDFSSGI